MAWYKTQSGCMNMELLVVSFILIPADDGYSQGDVYPDRSISSEGWCAARFGNGYACLSR